MTVAEGRGRAARRVPGRRAVPSAWRRPSASGAGPARRTATTDRPSGQLAAVARSIAATCPPRARLVAASRSGRSMAATSAVGVARRAVAGGRGEGGVGLVRLDLYGQRLPAGERRHERGRRAMAAGSSASRKSRGARSMRSAVAASGARRMASARRRCSRFRASSPVSSGWASASSTRRCSSASRCRRREGLVGFQGEAQQVERTRPFGRVEVAGQPQDRRLVEGVEATGGGPQQVAVGDEHRDLLLGRGAQVQPAHDPAGDGHLVGPLPQRLDQEPGQEQPLRMVREPGEVGGESGPGGLSEPFHQRQVVGGRRVHLEGVGLTGPQRRRPARAARARARRWCGGSAMSGHCRCAARRRGRAPPGAASAARRRRGSRATPPARGRARASPTRSAASSARGRPSAPGGWAARTTSAARPAERTCR